MTAARTPFAVPAHLDKAAPEPAVDVAALRTKGDLELVLGNLTTWGRGVAAQFAELRRLIDVFNGQAAAVSAPPAPGAWFGGPK